MCWWPKTVPYPRDCSAAAGAGHSPTAKNHGTPFDLTRAAYHLGNRHVPIELQPDHLKIEPDHVLADMLRAMHLIVTKQNLAFEPEGGAYAAGHGGHSHGGMGTTITTTTPTTP